MAISLSMPAQVTCVRCGHQYETQLWALVAGNERPDLLERARDGTLRSATCPHCQSPESLPEAPLLLYRPDCDPRLVFVTATGDTQDPVDQQALIRLADALRTAIGDEWRDEWAYDISITSTAALPELLGERSPLRGLLQEMVGLDWGAQRAFLIAHPELLGDPALAVLDETIERGDRDLEPASDNILVPLRALLCRAREVGVDAAFDEISPLRHLRDSQPLLELPALHTLLERLATDGVDIRSPEAVLKALHETSGLDQIVNEAVAAVLAELPRLTAPADVERRAELIRLALDLVGDRDNALRAQLSFELGNTLMSPTTRPEGRLTMAVGAYEQALEALDGEQEDRSASRSSGIWSLPIAS